MKKLFFSILLLAAVLSCGSADPNIGPSICPEDELVDSHQASSVVSTTSAESSQQTSASASTSGSGGSGGSEPVPDWENPGLDEIMSRLHACRKLTYAQLGNFLKNRGVAVPVGVSSDLKMTTAQVFGTSQTLSQLFGGSGSACEVAETAANGAGAGNDPLCPANETCFCNQDDKQSDVNRMCLDVGNNSPDAKDGYCVAKPSTPGFLYFTGKNSLGVPKHDSRLAEKDEHTTASAMKLMDIFIQSAPQIITNIGSSSRAPACTLNGKNLPMFSPIDGSCVAESVSCLIGTPATEDHVLLCNLLVSKAKQGDASDLNKKRIIAVAALLSAAHSCQ